MIYHQMPQVRMAIMNSPLTPGNSPLRYNNGMIRETQTYRMDQHRIPRFDHNTNNSLLGNNYSPLKKW